MNNLAVQHLDISTTHTGTASKSVLSSTELFNIDARKISSVLENKTVNVTITSPPYFDLKDYGPDQQIGFGQDYETYLTDLEKIFGDICERTAANGSLWVVIDSFRKGGQLFPLPFDLSRKLEGVGWQLKDVIIWKKDRTLPWSHSGSTRNIFEYVMVFGKTGNELKYYPDRVREFTDLKRWWVRYPERYHPKGKALEEVWNIDIPTQGSWGKSTPKHFCPFPPALVRRILRLTTDPGDTVLDPFAGTGSVLFEAQGLGRNSLGCELDKKLVTAFKKREFVRPSHEQSEDIAAQEFEENILNLRILKYARMLLRKCTDFSDAQDIWIYAEESDRKNSNKHSIVAADFYIVHGGNDHEQKKLEALLAESISIKPLSKFGIDAKINVTSKLSKSLKKRIKTKTLYIYSITNSHKFKQKITLENINNEIVNRSVISDIAISIEEPRE